MCYVLELDFIDLPNLTPLISPIPFAVNLIPRGCQNSGLSLVPPFLHASTLVSNNNVNVYSEAVLPARFLGCP